jgi:hypothetical protein
LSHLNFNDGGKESLKDLSKTPRVSSKNILMFVEWAQCASLFMSIYSSLWLIWDALFGDHLGHLYVFCLSIVILIEKHLLLQCSIVILSYKLFSLLNPMLPTKTSPTSNGDTIIIYHHILGWEGDIFIVKSNASHPSLINVEINTKPWVFLLLHLSYQC